jgi:NADH-quinone oxidoreductase subunit N
MHQEVGLLVLILLVFLFDTFSSRQAPRGLSMFTVCLFGLITIGGFFCPRSYESACAFGGMYATSPVMALIKNILNVGALIVLIQAKTWADSEFMRMRRGEFYELLLTTLFGMYLMVSARHFLLFIIGLETASLPLAAMVAFDKHRYESHEAAIKYLLTAVFSSAVFMMGLSFVYGLSGTLYFADIAASINSQNSLLLLLAIAFVIAGMGFKLSLVPFHLWTADVYQGAPTAITSYLSVISKGAAAFSFFVILVQVFGPLYGQSWEWMLYALIILTITVGNLFAMRQKNLKRFLAFSSISQAGYIMLGVIAASTQGLGSMMFYILVYIFSNLGAFGVIQAIENKTGKVDMDSYNNLYSTNPKLAFAMMLAMFSLAGIPPFAGFFSKFFIFAGATEPGTPALYVLVLIALVNTIISLYYYLLVVKAMFINNQEECAIATIRSEKSERVALCICVAGIILVGIASCIYNGIIDTAVLNPQYIFSSFGN